VIGKMQEPDSLKQITGQSSKLQFLNDKLAALKAEKERNQVTR
jgi:hypothetical protein